MKKLTQAVFDDAPDWVKSAAVDSDGYAYLYEDDTDSLVLRDFTFNNLRWGTAKKCLGGGYDVSDWQNSAIDRESVK